MKAAAFRYARATSAAHAQALLAEHGEDARLLAGGQSLLAALNLRLSEPAILVDIGRIGQADITAGDERLRLGALATHAAIGRSATVAEAAPMLAQAVPHIAHAAIRNRGTIGGSLALADPAGGVAGLRPRAGGRDRAGEPRAASGVCRRRRSSWACTARLAPGRGGAGGRVPRPRATSDGLPGAGPAAWRLCHGRRLGARGGLDGGRVGGCAPHLRRRRHAGAGTEAARAAEGAPVAGRRGPRRTRWAATSTRRAICTDGATRRHLARVLLRRAVEAMAS